MFLFSKKSIQILVLESEEFDSNLSSARFIYSSKNVKSTTKNKQSNRTNNVNTKKSFVKEKRLLILKIKIRKKEEI